MLKSILLIIMATTAVTFSACSSSQPAGQPSHNSDAVMWQQFQSDKAVDKLDKE